jgi:hypothetical protein
MMGRQNARPNWGSRYGPAGGVAARECTGLTLVGIPKLLVERKNAARAFGLGGVFGFDCEEVLTVLCRPGSDLLSQGLSHSTIGAEEFNGRVRDGIGFRLLARATRPAKDRDMKQAVRSLCDRGRMVSSEWRMDDDHAYSPLPIRYSLVMSYGH